MPRPKGAKNKPKFKYIKLSVLNEMFKPDMLIPVDFNRFFHSNSEQSIEDIAKEQIENKLKTLEEKIALEFTVR